MTHVRRLILPANPDEKARILETNLRRGWQPVPGISDHELGTILRADHPTGPLHVPARPALRRSRPSGWAPFWTTLIFVMVFAALLGWWAR